MRRPIRRRLILGTLVVVVLALAAGLWAFQPWKLFTSSTVHEALPMPAAESTAESGDKATPPQPEVLRTGRFVSGEHETTGRARVIDLTDGRRILRLENLSTSDGPDVRVVLSRQAVANQEYDSGQLIELGVLKATNGDQNYAIPATVDIDRIDSAVIWCARFDVSFGAAKLST